MRSLSHSLAQIMLLVMIVSLSGQGLPQPEDRDRINPIYLGWHEDPKMVELGGWRIYQKDDAGISWYPLWPYESGFWGQSAPRFIPAEDPLNIGEYHVPSIVEFLSPDFRPEGIDYSYYVPALGRFASYSWTPTENNYIYHVPAIASFLDDDWRPAGPEYDSYPSWIYWYLNY